MTTITYKFNFPEKLRPVGGLMLLILSVSVASITSSQGARAAQVSEPPVSAYGTSCHGRQGQSNGPATPTIAGLSRNYLVGAMLAYKYPEELERADALIEQDQDLEDVLVLARPPGVMNAIAGMLNLDEIKTVASYFSTFDAVVHKQEVDPAVVTAGDDVHHSYCEKCHEEGGRFTADDVGLLAGQWKLYLTYLFEDLASGERQMPKKMSDKLDA